MHNPGVPKAHHTRPLERPAILALLGVVAAFILANAFTLTLDPPVWLDEVEDADPAVNLLLTGRLTSTANPYPADAIVPNGWPYSLLLSVWLSVFGISTEAVRWFHATGVLLGVGIVCLGSRQWGLIRGSFALVLLSAVLLYAAPLTLVYRNSRYDVVGFVATALIFVAASWSPSVYRSAVMFLAAAVLPSTGIPLVLYLVLMSVIILWTCRGTLRTEFAWVFAGVIAGTAAYVFFLWRWNALSTLEELVQFTRSQAGLTSFSGSYLRDLTNTAVLLGLICVGYAGWSNGDNRSLRLSGVGLVFGLAVPFCMATAGRYTAMYAWMAFVPMALTLVAGLESLEGKRVIRFSAFFLLTAALLLGLPRSVVVSALEWRQRSYSPVVEFVTNNVLNNDIVYTDFAAYYPVKMTAKRAFVGREHLGVMGPDDKRSLSLVILNHPGGPVTNGVDRSLRTIGGEWTAVDHYDSGRGALRTSLFPTERSAIYRLTAYRRTQTAVK